MNAQRKIVSIAECDHFADYAELQSEPQVKRPLRPNYMIIGVGLLCAAFWLGVYFYFVK